MNDNEEWLLRGHAAASIAFNDPVWAAQTYEMDRGERVRGDYDPPLPDQLVDALRDRQRRMNQLEDLMVIQGRTKVPPAEHRADWVEAEGALLLAGRSLARHGIRWVPRYLLAEFLTLYETPLPTSAERHR